MSSQLKAPLIAPPKPKNARSKRAAELREPQVVEKRAKTALFVRGNNTSDWVKSTLSELSQLKKPYSINFNKKNEIRPFEDTTQLNFFSQKNDASIIVLGSHSKKRPHNLVLARTFNYEVVELLELGIEDLVKMTDVKGPKSAIGSVPLFHFATTGESGDLWNTHQVYGQFKSMVLDLYKGVDMDGVALKGLERVISVTIGEAGENQAGEKAGEAGESGEKTGKKALTSLLSTTESTATAALPPIHFRTYSIVFKKSGVATPAVTLVPHGPHFTFAIRRAQQPSAEVLKEAYKKPAKPKAKANKNIDINEMGDKVGRVHLGRQDLSSLQSRKFKALKRKNIERADAEAAEDDGGDASGDASDDGVRSVRGDSPIEIFEA